MALDKTIYIGCFVHSENLTTLDVCPNGMIGVDENGKIAWISRDMKGRIMPTPEDWQHAKVVRIDGLGFFFPGFIGMCNSWQALRKKKESGEKQQMLSSEC